MKNLLFCLKKSFLLSKRSLLTLILISIISLAYGQNGRIINDSTLDSLISNISYGSVLKYKDLNQSDKDQINEGIEILSLSGLKDSIYYNPFNGSISITKITEEYLFFYRITYVQRLVGLKGEEKDYRKHYILCFVKLRYECGDESHKPKHSASLKSKMLELQKLNHCSKIVPIILD